MVENTAAKAGDSGLIPGSGKSPGEENGNPLQFFHGKSSSFLEKPGKIFPDGYSPWGHKRVRHDLVTKQQLST